MYGYLSFNMEWFFMNEMEIEDITNDMISKVKFDVNKCYNKFSSLRADEFYAFTCRKELIEPIKNNKNLYE